MDKAPNKGGSMNSEEARQRVATLLQQAHSIMSREIQKELNECLKVIDPNFDLLFSNAYNSWLRLDGPSSKEHNSSNLS